ncbi:beta-ketoacyl-[acyl-carrier-protein] synthase family protein [Aquabacterium sp.]|uniref:beta-ketoacyl-[acyl-carrier-protein] synthase family protein n=1 Tax=Aquabacterium sp. TaxID=1872578 RepID=UPI0035B0920E
MPPLRLRAMTLTSALGAGLAPTLQALRTRRSGVQRRHWETVTDLDTCIGEVDGIDAVELPAELAHFDCRNNRLAELALRQDGFDAAVRDVIARVGADRVGVFVGTSTSGIHTSEQAYRHRDPATGALPTSLDYRHTHNSYSLADYVRHRFGLSGTACVISTACSSSAKVFGMAQRMVACGLVDAAIVGGVDSLCLTTLYGFQSLQLLSPQPCMPFDVNRQGINIGEAGAFALLEPAPQAQAGDILLTGVGESSDAHHMSAPHPQGLGARLAMQAALNMAGLQPADIGYIALHGTSTPSNDAAESQAVEALFGQHVPCSSIKGHTGHTLGAAGAINAVVAALALRHDLAPAGAGTREVDPALPCHYLIETLDRPLRHVLSNAFGFGGNNCSLVLSKQGAA